MSGAFVAAGDGFTSGGGLDYDWTTPWMNISFMYHVTELFTIDAFLGFMVSNTHIPGDDAGMTIFQMGFGPRALFTLATFDRTRVYTGVGIAMLIGYNVDAYDNDPLSDGGCDGECSGSDMYGIALAAPLGIEYRFRSAPHLALSLEVNFHFVYESTGTRALDGDGDLESSDLASRLLVGMGNPRVTEGVANLFDFLNFLTLGLHYQL